MGLNFLGLPSLLQLIFHSTGQLADRIILILDYVLLPGEEKIAFKNIKEKSKMGEGLTDAVVS